MRGYGESNKSAMTEPTLKLVMVRVVGLEPTLQRNWILNPARLPIPPHPRSAHNSSGG